MENSTSADVQIEKKGASRVSTLLQEEPAEDDSHTATPLQGQVHPEAVTRRSTE